MPRKQAQQLITQQISKILKRPVGLNESALKVQEEVLKKQNRAGARDTSKPIKSLPSDSAALKKKINEFNKGVKNKKPVIDERLEMMLGASRSGVKPTKRKKSRFEKAVDKDPQILGMGIGPMAVGVVAADDYAKDTRKIIKEATAKRDKTATFMKRSRKKDQIEEYLYGGQAKIDANKDGKISGEDFKILRARKKSIGGMAIKGFKNKTPIY